MKVSACIYGNIIFQTRSQIKNAKIENDDASMLEEDMWQHVKYTFVAVIILIIISVCYVWT